MSRSEMIRLVFIINGLDWKGLLARGTQLEERKYSVRI